MHALAEIKLSDGFVDGILRLCDNPDLRKTMSENARAYTRNRTFVNSFLTFWNNYR